MSGDDGLLGGGDVNEKWGSGGGDGGRRIGLGAHSGRRIGFGAHAGRRIGFGANTKARSFGASSDGFSPLDEGWAQDTFLPVDRFGEVYCVDSQQCASGYACVGNTCIKTETDLEASISTGGFSGPGSCSPDPDRREPTPDKCNSGSRTSCTAGPTCGSGSPTSYTTYNNNSSGPPAGHECCGKKSRYVVLHSIPGIQEAWEGWVCDDRVFGSGGSTCDSVCNQLSNIGGDLPDSCSGSNKICSNATCEYCDSFHGSCRPKNPQPCECSGCPDCWTCVNGGCVQQDPEQCKYCETYTCPPDSCFGESTEVEACASNKFEAQRKAASSCGGSSSTNPCSYYTRCSDTHGTTDGLPGQTQVGWLQAATGEECKIYADCSSSKESLDCCGVQCHCGADCDSGVCVNGTCGSQQVPGQYG